MSYLKFKKLLEYFVAHLEWEVNKDKNGRGYHEYIEGLISRNEYKRTGQGYKGDNIQNQIKGLDNYDHGRICINIQQNFGSYYSNKCYLNWNGTGINIVVVWNKEIKKITYLYQDYYYPNNKLRKRLSKNISPEMLGLFDEQDHVNKELKLFYENYESAIINHNMEQNIGKQRILLKPYIDLLKINKNIILTGAPGTGKTYLAKQIAKELGEYEFVQFHPSYDYTDFVEGLRPVKKHNGELGFELKDGLFINFCKKALQNLEDSEKSGDKLSKENNVRNNIITFLEACIDHNTQLELSNGNTFSITEYNNKVIKVFVPGNEKISNLSLPIVELESLLLAEVILEKVKDVRLHFKRNYHRQEDSYIFSIYNNQDLSKEIQIESEVETIEKKNFVLIIDEINRAEISKVFGELFYSLDPGYRGEKGQVRTQYDNLKSENDAFFKGFYVPENVYIIGTMNDIDRSVESMDFAMRRRFAWREVSAESRMSMWEEEIDEYIEEATQRLKALNSAIEKIQGLNSAYHIGPAYFLKLQLYRNEVNPFEELWQNHLKGVLYEYLRGLPNALDLLEELKLAYDLDEHV